MLKENLRADLRKMKGTAVMLGHLLIPLFISGLFLLYASFSPWNEKTKIIAFYQAIGAGLPVLIGIFTASMIEQEENAGDFQNLLASPKKIEAFGSKILLLLVLGFFSLVFTAIIFGFGLGAILGSPTVEVGMCLKASLLMWCGSIPIYLWQMIFAFQLGKGAAIGGGILSGLVSALMLTGLGDKVWKYLFISWTSRIPDAYLAFALGESAAINDLAAVMPIYVVFTAMSMVYYVRWASRWEGSRISE